MTSSGERTRRLPHHVVDSSSVAAANRHADPGPGKRTLTEALPAPATAGTPVQRSTSGNAAHAPPPMLQRRFAIQRAATSAAENPADVHAAAARGTATSATQLPHFERIQRVFGRHDVSSVKAHAGADAADSAREIGARAYATGDHVVLGESADLHTVAHEAAHVVQQRGGVRLEGGVGQVGDAYERQADEVANRVVRGESAEELLGASSVAGPQGPPSTGAIQCTKGLVKGQSVLARGQPGTVADRRGNEGNEVGYQVDLGNGDIREFFEYEVVPAGHAAAPLPYPRSQPRFLPSHYPQPFHLSDYPQQAPTPIQRPATPPADRAPGDESVTGMKRRRGHPLPSELPATTNRGREEVKAEAMNKKSRTVEAGQQRHDAANETSGQSEDEENEEEEKEGDQGALSRRVELDGADKEGSALSEAYVQLCDLGLTALPVVIQQDIWKQVQAVNAMAQKIFGSEDWDRAGSRNRLIKFGLLFSPFLSPQELLAKTEEYNEIDIDTSQESSVRSVFLVGNAAKAAHQPRASLDGIPDLSKVLQDNEIHAIKYAYANGMKIYVPLGTEGCESTEPSVPSSPQTESCNRLKTIDTAPLGSLYTMREELAGSELEAWDELNEERGDGVQIAAVGEIPVYEAPMALVARIDLEKNLDFYKKCIDDRALKDRGQGMQCASLVGPGADAISYTSSPVAVELEAKPELMMAMAKEDLQSPNQEKCSSIREYLELALRAQVIAQHVRILALAPREK